jgi:radical SAM protein with 4Fe4S-binding SPASM domain
MKNELPMIEHTDLIWQARKMGATILSLSGGNPLLYDTLPGKDLYTLIELAEELGYEKILLYNTGHNAEGDTIDTWPAVEKVLDNCPHVIWIFSLHSHLAMMNNHIMRKANALQSIKRSMDWLSKNDATVEVHMVPMKINYKHIPDVRILCKYMGVSKLSLLRFVPQTRGFKNRDELSMTKAEFADMQTIMWQELQKDSPVELRLGCPIEFLHALGLREQKAKPCHAGDDLILVRPDGATHPCAAWKSSNIDSNVRDKSLQEVWESDNLFEAIREFKQEGYKQVSGCANCRYVHSCLAGCPAQRFHEYGRTLDALYDPRGDPLCPRSNS